MPENEDAPPAAIRDSSPEELNLHAIAVFSKMY
jgi:hypothetical protein